MHGSLCVMLADWKHKLKLRLPALLLLAATLLFWNLYDRYEQAGPILLQSPSLADSTKMRGDCVETNGHFTLTVPPGGRTASVSFRLHEAMDYDRIRVRGRMKLDGVLEGKHYWDCARLLLVQYDDRDKWIPGMHSLVSEKGTKDWAWYEDVFVLDDRAANADVVIQQIGREGSAEYDQLVAEPVRLRSSFRWWRMIFAAAWVTMAVLYFRRCRLHRRKLRLFILLNVLAIIFGTLMPETWIEETSDYARKEAVRVIEKTAARPGPATSPPPQSTSRNDEQEKIGQLSAVVGGAHGIGHFALFASLCFLVYLSAALERQPRIYFIKVAFDVLLFAGVTESLQYLTLDRTPGVRDWLIDLCGMAVAFVCFLVVLMAFRPGAGKAQA